MVMRLELSQLTLHMLHSQCKNMSITHVNVQIGLFFLNLNCTYNIISTCCKKKINPFFPPMASSPLPLSPSLSLSSLSPSLSTVKVMIPHLRLIQ